LKEHLFDDLPTSPSDAGTRNHSAERFSMMAGNDRESPATASILHTP
jgi:hypothetical protein